MAFMLKTISASNLLLIFIPILYQTIPIITAKGYDKFNNNNSYIYHHYIKIKNDTSTRSTREYNVKVIRGRELEGNKCNWFQGKWVFDPSYPLYQSSNCPFIDPEFNCQKYGRPDNYFLKYRWQPLSCDLPKFNGLNFLEKWRGKKIMFVGDSLSFNQWQSLTCLLHSWAPNSKTSVMKTGDLSSVTFEVINILFFIIIGTYLLL